MHWGTKPGRFETSNHSLSHKLGRREWVSERASERMSAAERASKASSVEQQLSHFYIWENLFLSLFAADLTSTCFPPPYSWWRKKKKVFPSSSRRQFWNRCYRCHSLLSPAVIYLSAVSISRKRKMQKYVTFDSRNMLTIENIEIEKVLWYTRGTGTPIYWLIFTGWLVFRKDWTWARRLISNQ